MHLSDLHIGIKLMNYDLKEEQQYVFQQIIEYAKEERPDAVLIAGDIYDKSIPGAEAVELLDQFVTSLHEALPEGQIMMISGNHDSQQRVDCYRGLLRRQNIHMVGMPPRTPEEKIEKIVMKDSFGHGTGHGIGFFLNVHEGPQAIRQELKNQDVVPGMVTSDEPGLYREGSHGIRHENMIICIPVSKNEFGEWYGFETLTLCYFDTSALLLDLLSEDEKKWLNDYHKTVYEKTAPYLTPEEAQWLAEKTKPVL